MKNLINKIKHLHRESRLFLYFCILAIIFSFINVLASILNIKYLDLMTTFISMVFGSKIVCFYLLSVDTWKRRLNNSIFLIRSLIVLELIIIPLTIIANSRLHEMYTVDIIHHISVPLLSIFLLLQRKEDLKQIHKTGK